LIIIKNKRKNDGVHGKRKSVEGLHTHKFSKKALIDAMLSVIKELKIVM
jgi:hypothetical protein